MVKRKDSSNERSDDGRSSGAADLGSLGTNLRSSRTRRGLSIERLSERSGVSRAMISQIELEQSSPTIKV
jgi:ribosome-binding protein aMBF1 (putative translation factor)